MFIYFTSVLQYTRTFECFKRRHPNLYLPMLGPRVLTVGKFFSSGKKYFFLKISMGSFNSPN